ncbi:low molecular weight protein arginine phosphatase [Tumebacillus sp. ITR2]|uniref:Low molecular weight protein arginine phosphatase n=1 Tax=Tumebacillus amylolyticus TaxID=2801339 RepID=A0ABS1J569_9BACL|nr:low molecular weight protein arginine phosphatase [Tumebacillus amylolyticus]MBL0385426.1 low molecular weight protein arginine phosphatase [Tumebacillus amylolyticus]
MNLLFVCTGNTCRSAMAEPLMRKRLDAAGLGDAVEVRSAGIAAYAGQPASKGAKQVLTNHGLDPDAHMATPLDDELVKWADLILTMSQSHKRAILERHFEALDKTFQLKEFVDDDPESLRILEEMGELQAEAQTKQALFMAEHADEIESLQQRYADSGGQDATIDDELAALQERLEASVQQEADQMMKLVAKLPDYDIADPYGGTQDTYDTTGQEIGVLLDKLVVRLKEEGVE